VFKTYQGKVHRWSVDFFSVKCAGTASICGIQVAYRLLFDFVLPITTVTNIHVDIMMASLCAFETNSPEMVSTLPFFNAVKEPAVAESLDLNSGVETPVCVHARPGDRFHSVDEESGAHVHARLLERLTDVEQEKEAWGEEVERLKRQRRTQKDTPYSSVNVQFSRYPGFRDTYDSEPLIQLQNGQWVSKTEFDRIKLIHAHRVLDAPESSFSGDRTQQEEEDDGFIPQEILDESRRIADEEEAKKNKKECLNFSEGFNLDPTYTQTHTRFFKFEPLPGRKDTKAVPGAVVCTICQKRVPQTIFAPCGHKVACIKCTHAYCYLENTCSVCRAVIICAALPIEN
jgi:hypothetical protein